MAETFIEGKFIFRKVRVTEGRELAALRLYALQTDGGSFVATIEEEQQMDVENYIQKNYVLGVFDEKNRLVGTLVYMEQERQKFKHIGILGGMYVHPDFRGLGLGKKLIDEMLKILRKFDHLYGLQLKVVTDNRPAIRLYESLGFSIWATEKNALFHNGNFFDQHHMMLQLSG